MYLNQKRRLILKTEYDKRRHLQVQIDKFKLALSAAHEEIIFLKRELALCQEVTTKQSQK